MEKSLHYVAGGRTLAAILKITENRGRAYQARVSQARAMGGTGRVVGTDDQFTAFEVPQKYAAKAGLDVHRMQGDVIVASPAEGREGKHWRKWFARSMFRLPGLWDFAGLCGVPAKMVNGNKPAYATFQKFGDTWVVTVQSEDAPAPYDSSPISAADLAALITQTASDLELQKVQSETLGALVSGPEAPAGETTLEPASCVKEIA
jgi:hypothetical protein